MKRQYINKRFRQETLKIIDEANTIIEEYSNEGYELTLRQLYYQFVSRNIIPNTEKEYSKLGNIISDGRLCGYIDWNAIIDRTRNLQKILTFKNPADRIRKAAMSYHIDQWEGQKYKVEAWVEKEALIGVIERTCDEYDVPYFACRGCVSQSEMWNAAQRIKRYIVRDGQIAVILYFGDHDPSGIDMSRDIKDRLRLFANQDFDISEFMLIRVALNIEQVRKYRLPPNPAKITDSRSDRYINEFGKQSWELDAMSPKDLTEILKLNIVNYISPKLFLKMQRREVKERKLLEAISYQLEEKDK